MPRTTVAVACCGERLLGRGPPIERRRARTSVSWLGSLSWFLRQLTATKRCITSLDRYMYCTWPILQAAIGEPIRAPTPPCRPGGVGLSWIWTCHCSSTAQHMQEKVERLKSAAAYPIYTQTRLKLAVHHVCVVRRSQGWDDHYDSGAG